MLTRSRRRRDLRRRPRRDRQRHAGAALDVQGRAGRRRLHVHRPQVVRQPDAGLDPARRARHGHERSRRRRRSSTRSCRAAPPASRSRRRGTCSACARPAATTPCSRRRSAPTSTSPASLPAGAAGMDAFVLGIFAWALLNFGNVYYGLALRVRDLIVEHVKSKTSIALTRSMAYHPRRPARHRRDDDGARSDRPATRRGHARLVGGRGSRPDWLIKIVAAKYRAVEGGVAGRRSRARPVGRLRHVQEERAGAAVPRRARRTLPSGELAAHSRTGRQADAWESIPTNSRVGGEGGIQAPGSGLDG